MTDKTIIQTFTAEKNPPPHATPSRAFDGHRPTQSVHIDHQGEVPRGDYANGPLSKGGR
jgi:hypothetical protein